MTLITHTVRYRQKTDKIFLAKVAILKPLSIQKNNPS